MRYSLSVAALLLGATAQAAEWRYLEPQDDVPLTLSRVVPGANGSYWLLDGNAVRHIDASGALLSLQRNVTPAGVGGTAPDYGFQHAYSDGFATADGGVVLHDTVCGMMRVEPGLRPTWHIQIPSCYELDGNADGIFWTRSYEGVAQHGPDGVQRAAPSLIFAGRRENAAAIDALPDGGALVLSWRAGAPTARVTRFDPAGQPRWSWSGSSHPVQTIAGTGDDGAFAIGISGATLAATRLDRNGSVVRSVDTPVATEWILSATAAGDAVYVVTGVSAGNDTRPQSLVRFGSDGRLDWQQPFCAGDPALQPAGAPDLAIDADGSVANLCAGGAQPQLLRRDAAGAAAAPKSLPFGSAQQLQQGTGGQVLVLGQTADGTQLIAVDRNGNVAPTVVRAPVDRAPLRLWAAATDTDDATYLLTQADPRLAARNRHSITKVRADGSRAWRIDMPGFALRDARLVAGHGLICGEELVETAPQLGSSPKHRAWCLDGSDGRSLFETELLNDSSATQLRVRPLEGGRSLMLTATATDHTLTLRDRNGLAVASSTQSGFIHRAAIDGHGRTTVVRNGVVTQYDSDGRIRFSVPHSLAGHTLDDPGVGEDGGVYLVGQAETQGTFERSLLAIAPDGSARWTRPLGEGRARSTVLVGRDAVYVLQYAAGGTDNAGLSPSLLSKLSIADGQQRWRHVSANPLLNYPLEMPAGRLAMSASGDALLLAHSWINRLRIERLDDASGALLDERFVACGRACAPPSILQVAGDGTARIATTRVDAAAGQTALVQALPGMDRAAPRTRVDQPGVTGLWYSPYANGEGLSIDWLPDSRTLFAAWFTYSREGGNDPSQQRWYTLQANGVAAATRTLELPILRTEGGNFDAGPPVAPHRVGLATLHFTDCNNASLRYAFDGIENGGVSGTLSLTRLTPATQDCTLADGSTHPGSGARPPAKGFDARLSGAWYDESSVGQGLQLNIQPDGVFFAPWFTYDPAEQLAGNDRYRQHWFTLQGNLADARNGVVELALIQTLGGVFDRVPTYNANIVGSATLSVQRCDRATLDYRFHAGPVAGPFAARSGSLSLTRSGGCAP